MATGPERGQLRLRDLEQRSDPLNRDAERDGDLLFPRGCIAQAQRYCVRRRQLRQRLFALHAAEHPRQLQLCLP